MSRVERNRREKSKLPHPYECSVCQTPSRYRLYCERHHRQVWLHGKITDTGRSRFLPNEFIIDGDVCRINIYNKHGNVRAQAIIDAEDVQKCAPFKWSIKSNGYVKNDRTNLYLHRFLLGLAVGDPNEVDHRDRNRLDCRKSNLRECSRAQNARNMVRKRTHLYKGVACIHGSWYARICVDYKKLSFGPFKNQVEAAKAYDAAALHYHGEFARTNGL